VIGTDLRADAAEMLRRCQMPPDEIRWVLTANDSAVVHMILELHRERLEEELAERRKALGEIEAWLTKRAISDPAAHSRREGIHDHDAVDLSTRLEVFG
jgi:hypothetical protein